MNALFRVAALRNGIDPDSFVEPKLSDYSIYPANIAKVYYNVDYDEYNTLLYIIHRDIE